MLRIIATLALLASSLFDGATTLAFLRKGMIEGDPLMVFLYGSNKPPAWRVLLIGALCIGSELSTLWILPGVWQFAASIALLLQSLIHIYCGIQNIRYMKEI